MKPRERTSGSTSRSRTSRSSARSGCCGSCRLVDGRSHGKRLDERNAAMGAPKAVRRKASYTRLRFKKGDPAHNLLAATQHYVISLGGKVVIVGGIEIQNWPEDGPHSFRVGIHCTGRSGPAKAK